MKTIEVVAAVIRKDDKIFATQLGYGEWKDWWEFPGGERWNRERHQRITGRFFDPLKMADMIIMNGIKTL